MFRSSPYPTHRLIVACMQHDHKKQLVGYMYSVASFMLECAGERSARGPASLSVHEMYGQLLINCTQSASLAAIGAWTDQTCFECS